MRDKRTILNIALVLILMISFIVSVILFNEFSKAKQSFSNAESRLNESKVEIGNAQAQYKVLETSIADAQKENVKLLASKVPSDPNKKLSSGITLWNAKISIDNTIKSLEAQGYKDADMQGLLEVQAEKMGTTLDEIKRLPAAEVVQTAPVKQVTTPSKPATTTPSKPATTPSKQTTTPSKSATPPAQSQPAQSSSSSSSGDSAHSGFGGGHEVQVTPDGGTDARSSGLEAN